MNKPVPQNRWYAHGDQVENKPNLYYCASCDFFLPREHFAEHENTPHRKPNLDKYAESLKKWKKKYSKLADFRRPSNPPNLFA